MTTRFRRRLLAVAIALSVVTGCSDGSGGRDDESGDEGDELGQLIPYVADRRFDGMRLPPVDLDLRELNNMAVAPDGALWALVAHGASGNESGASADLVVAGGDQVETIDVPQGLKPNSGIGVGPDGTAYLIADTGELVRFRDGEVIPTGFGGPGELFHPTAASDGTVYVADHANGQIVAIGPHGSSREVVTGVPAGAMAAGPDGMLYFQDRDAGVRALSPSGEIRDIAGFGDEEPRDGAVATDADIVPAGMAANDDGLYVVFGNQIWLIDGDNRLHLVLERPWHPVPADGPDDNDIRLYEIAAGGHDVYVWDNASGVIYRVEPDE
jgi:hypothetical protein